MTQHRYLLTEDVPAIGQLPAGNRIEKDGIILAWKSTGWRTNIEYCPVSGFRVRQHDLVLYKDERSVGMAMFKEVHIKEDMTQENLLFEMDQPSQELSDLSIGIMQAQLRFFGDDNLFAEGSRYVEFAKLAVRPGVMPPSIWEFLINQFIRFQFKNTRSGLYKAMLLCPFPLEFESRCTDEVTVKACNLRRLALVRLYSKKLGVELVTDVDKLDGKWWMARILGIRQ